MDSKELLFNSLLRPTNLWPSDSRSNWNLEMLVFEEGGKPENPEKNPQSKDENQQQTNLIPESPLAFWSADGRPSADQKARGLWVRD